MSEKKKKEEDIFRGLGVEIEFKSPNAFQKVRETLTRIGIPTRQGNVLAQSCHILHKQGRYRIMHFKELFLMDGKTADISEDDIGRRNTITVLLEEWGLLKIKDTKAVESPRTPLKAIKIIKFSEKGDWSLEPKYTIGKKRSIANED